MKPFERLGLEPDADEREIKRAYARELKRFRPDEDPLGFQALNEAYQYCLAYAEHLRWQASAESQEHAGHRSDEDACDSGGVAHREMDTSDNRSRPTSEPMEPVSAPAPVEFDFNEFMNELLYRASYQASAGLSRWLREIEPLYSLDLKLALRVPVLQVLAQIERPLPVEATQVIFEFFALDLVSEHDAWLREHAFETQGRAESNQRFGRTLEALQSQKVKSVDRMLARELAQSRHWGRRIFIALMPMLPTRLISTLNALEEIDPRQAALQLDEESVRFWRSATDPRRISLQRLAIIASRLAIYFVAIVSLLSALTDAAVPQAFDTFAIACAVWFGWAVLQAAVLRWSPEALRERLDRLTVVSTIALIAAAWLSPTQPFVAGALAFAVSSLHNGDRGVANERLAYYATLMMIAAWGLNLFVVSGSFALAIPFALIGTSALLIAHSLVLAWRRGITVPQARGLDGWHGYLIAASVLAIAYGLFKLANG